MNIYAYILGLILLTLANVVLASTGIGITDWQYWGISISFILGSFFINQSNKYYGG